MSLVAGVDIGSLTAKTVIMDEEARVLSFSILPQGIVSEKAALSCLEQALGKAHLTRSDLNFILTTGYGRELVKFGDRSVTEISCHACGAHSLFPEARMVIDIGGQDSKVIALDEQGRLINFIMNDKCAAGTGRFLEVMARALGVELEEMGEFSLKSQQPAHVSSICTVFAESEVISLAARSYSKIDIIAGIHEAIGRRLVSMVKAVRLREPVVMTGGVAKNKGVVQVLERLLATQIIIPPEPQVVGALGAALFALEEVKSPAR